MRQETVICDSCEEKCSEDYFVFVRVSPASNDRRTEDDEFEEEKFEVCSMCNGEIMSMFE